MTPPVQLLDTLTRIEEEGLAAIESSGSLDELEAARIRYLGRSGGLTDVLRRLGQAPAAQRPVLGAAANEAKRRLQAALEERAVALKRAPSTTRPPADLTMPGRRACWGGVHPVTRVIDEICEIFRELGFSRVRGPEAETEWYNFEALNIPLEHPAADMWDTFYLADGVLLRSHTSPVQARIMETHDPPVRVVVPGMCYRRDPFDATHAPAFEQIEGLAVDEGIDFVEFRFTIEHFVHRFFGKHTRTRFRPAYFPFTEPSAEVDATCGSCGGDGCSTCKGTGWIEIMGSGMVHPAVFEAVGYDPERYTGYAFGMGPARIAMARYGIPDIRLFYEGDLRFLEQFR
ncbi:MAG: phenylalanine--tRNA ligase subunit alpha [Gemmatimonadetes bacterium]|nr:phenylalanine--tRNA ligase subunit alpha [Gemmatimonadota bacterium]